MKDDEMLSDANATKQPQPGDAAWVSAEIFCATPLPDSVCSDRCASMQGYPHRTGTNLLTVAEAAHVLLPAVSIASEAAFRAGFSAAEEALGAHGSERLLDSIERGWTEYAADTGLSTLKDSSHEG